MANSTNEVVNENLLTLIAAVTVSCIDLSSDLKFCLNLFLLFKKIGKSGAQLNKLAGLIAENVSIYCFSVRVFKFCYLHILRENKIGTIYFFFKCPHSMTRSDLIAYLQRVALYSHQLSITAKVKSDIQFIGGEMIVSGVRKSFVVLIFLQPKINYNTIFLVLQPKINYNTIFLVLQPKVNYNTIFLVFKVESATSLIQAAKNLMNAVILTVKSSYIASTNHRTTNQVRASIHQNLSLIYLNSLNV